MHRGATIRRVVRDGDQISELKFAAPPAARTVPLSLARYRQSVLRATEDIESSFMALVQLEAQSQELADEVVALTRARDKSQAAYLGGAIDLTDVLDAIVSCWCRRTKCQGRALTRPDPR